MSEIVGAGAIADLMPDRATLDYLGIPENPRIVGLMLLPGWVTGHGLTRQKNLERLGNGVVPVQAAAAGVHELRASRDAQATHGVGRMIGPKVPKPTRAEARAARKAVAARSGGLCEGCGRRWKSDGHHRQHGSNGRVDTVDNLLDLCGGPGGMAGGNHSGCHGVAHSGTDGYLLGWSVKDGCDPAEIPVYHLHRGTYTLRGEPIALATAAAIFVARGVVPDTETFIAWFETRRLDWWGVR